MLRRPARPAAPIGGHAFWLALALLALLTAADDWLASQPPRHFDPDGLPGLAFQALLALAAGGLLARFGAARQRLVWLVSGLVLLLPALSEMLLRPVEHGLLPMLVHWSAEDITHATDALWVLWLAASCWRLLQWLAPGRGAWLRLGVAVLATAISIGPRYYVSLGHLVVSDAEESSEGDDTQDDEDGDEPDSEPSFDADEVMRSQQRLVGEAIAQLAPQRPDQVDLYLVGFAGDGSEKVFRNEVEYADRLFRERFEAEGRTLMLTNSPATVATRPLATLENLRLALSAIGRLADRQQDIVAVYLSSHGSAEHELLVNLPPLPLPQIDPAALRAALDECGVRHRVAMISACYSGGFVPALANPDTLVLTAARADRPSFGCGNDSEITYFGRALLVHGLNRESTFDDAFRLAEREISAWETARKEPHSHPQRSTGPGIEAQLAAWRAGVRLGLPVAFAVADPAPDPFR